MTFHERNEPIAVVGSACRFAGDANSPSKLWHLLQEPHDLRQEIPTDRFNAKAFYHPDWAYHGHSNVMHAYLINEDLSAFDAEFFGIKPIEAKAMDPQQRFLLEVVYEGLEAAGMPVAHLKGSDTGVYTGIMFDDYGTMLLRDLQATPTYYATGTGRSILANRISYFFDWHGPSITIDTACSSSLVAVHMAVQSLRAGDSRVALACGSNLILGPENFVIESKLKMLSPDGLSRMWDQNANGYARGEGVAVLVLKTLSAALADGDHIECIIKETALNQDGATSGITMPSASAQETLIRSTYAKAGLDLLVQGDRPQYFEAHGTGTPAGDPTEAEAIRNAFFFNDLDIGSDHPLYVGSIKTVLGHTEGTAGVAALLKASLALQHGNITPNLHFKELSDRVAPFYKDVEIPSAAMPWPDVMGGPRRASVNSFGFGGANAHAILEQYNLTTDSPHHKFQESHVAPLSTKLSPYAPYVFSAFTESSLRANLQVYAAFFEGTQREIDLRDLAWTLRQRRSILPYRISFTASSIDDLRTKMLAKVQEETANIGIKAFPTAKLLGIFTGQGAQYARMGAELIETSETAREIVQKLESYLAHIPGDVGPKWSLQTEILADAARVHEATMSQPLCTAIQILLVDLLELAGVHFDAVVGHSSGEIGAAYAAGYITAQEAMYIAYYRGVHAGLASSPHGHHIKGAMMAVGSSMEDVAELCADKSFVGHVNIAASNSPSSVTVSGDEDAIAKLELILDDEKKFNRRLKVDKAYHSAHMLPCLDPYLTSLRRCAIEPKKPKAASCTWFSSVFDRPVDSDMIEQLGSSYWAENMIKPVLFSQAVSRALAANLCDLVVEVGSHPSLKGPVNQTIRHTSEKELPYHGLLARGTNALEATSAGLGFLWSYLDNSRINLDNYERAMTNDGHCFSLVKGLPTYQWNHEIKYWHESRISRKMRLRRHPVHPLLGNIAPDSAPHHMSWRNLLRVSEMDWLLGHQVQNQVVFPAAGYVSIALEASRYVAEDMGEEIRLLELRDFTIHQPVVFDQDDTGVEVLLSMADIVREVHQQPARILAKVAYSAALGSHHAEELTLVASGRVEILLGEADQYLLPTRKPLAPHTIDVEPDRFYAALADLGYNFADGFRSLSMLRRKRGRSSGLVKMCKTEGNYNSLLVHPVELDAALQSVILAYSYPYDEQLRTMHLPTTIQHIRVNPALCGAASKSQEEFAPVDAATEPQVGGQRGIVGHVDLYFGSSQHVAIQVQGANFMPLGGAAAEEDRRVFSKVSWIASQPDGVEAARNVSLGETQRAMVSLLERISTFYLRSFEREVPSDHPKRSEFPTNWYLNFAQHVTSMVESGKHKWVKKEWLEDSFDDVMEASKSFSGTPDVEIMHLVGAQMPYVFKGETTMLEQFRANGNDILDRYYADAFGMRESAEWVSQELFSTSRTDCRKGAGTGGATRAILRKINQSFLSYTYTDVSAAFFENASSAFSHFRDRMIFKTFDAERDPMEQGFVEGSYDLVVAFFVIHATSDLERCLRNIRKLLAPGGFLVVGEGQEGQNGVASSGFIFGTLPGWWLGAESGRALSPHVSPQKWHKLLKSTGFSGVDTSPPKSFEDVLNVFHFVSQAVDDQVNFFREPLAASSWQLPPIQSLVIIGGRKVRTSRLIKELKSIFSSKNLATEIHSFETLTDIHQDAVDANSTVVSLTELDWPVFKDITQKSFGALKRIFESGKTLLWITNGRRDDEPFSNMTVGFGRTATHESPDLRLQQLDITEPQSTNAQSIAETLLRFHAASYKKDNLLWTVEPEIVIDDRQYQLISRLRPIPELNDRYNSARRTITQDRDFRESPVAMHLNSNGCVGEELTRYETLEMGNRGSESLVELHTMYAVHSALSTPFGHKFLVLGVQPETGTPHLAFVPSLASVLKVPEKSAVSCPQLAGLSHGQFLKTMAAHVVAAAVLHPSQSGQTVVIHNPSIIIAQALATQAAAKNVHMVYCTDPTDGETMDHWIKLPRYLSQNEAKEMLLHHKPSSFIGLSNDETERSGNEVTMISCLPHTCQNIMTTNTIYSYIDSASGYSSIVGLEQILRKSLEHVLEDVREERNLPLPTTESYVRLDSLARGSRPRDPMSIIDWTAATSMPVNVKRLDTSPMFRGDSGTYWIVGIDVTDEAGLKEVHRRICKALPPIAGVMNGAMVLRDTSIRNMSFDQLTDVIRPKVDGSVYLDRIFWDIDLDFFVLVSSINCIIGNLGQANYAAANTFMCGLAAQRRKRGFRAATVNAGAIVGAGYMERESRRALDQIVERLHMMRLSEEDWCQAICEAIDASRLESPHGPELTTGLSDIPFDIPNAPSWYSNPKFSSFIVHQQTIVEDKDKVKAATSIHELLRACQSQQDLQLVIKQALATQLRNILQVTASDDDLMSSRSTEIGLDSLVSVDIRSWFLKQLQVSVPILKIMGNDTMANLVQFAIDNVPAELVPHLSNDGVSHELGNTTVEEGTSESLPESLLDTSSPGRTSSPSRTPLSKTLTTNGHKPGTATYDSNVIDWEAEARPPADMAEITPAPNPTVVNTPPRVIVLTGVSGLLGLHLLDHLLMQNSTKKVICIAVRQLGSRLQNQELLHHSRVVYHEGDLSRPFLGLTAHKAASIFAEADVVIHNGADTSHLKYYTDLQAANFGSTVTLARLCLPRRIPIHYVSSAGLAILYHDNDAFPATTVMGPGCSLPPSDGSFGYMCSKWTNERFLERIHDLYGMRVFIHRPSTIIREGADARTAQAQLDWVNALLHYARRIKAVPRIGQTSGSLDLVYVRNVCADMMSHIFEGNVKKARGVTYVHEVGDVVIPLDRLQEIGMEEEEKKLFDVLAMHRWVDKAVAAGLHPAVATLIETMDTPNQPKYPRLLKTATA
ncbi:MAG: hypothetical protein Q9165_006617 [Trypethelium subeluteriae]